MKSLVNSLLKIGEAVHLLGRRLRVLQQEAVPAHHEPIRVRGERLGGVVGKSPNCSWAKDVVGKRLSVYLPVVLRRRDVVGAALLGALQGVLDARTDSVEVRPVIVGAADVALSLVFLGLV